MEKKLINFELEDLGIMDYYIGKLNFRSRSEFIRWAIRNCYKKKDPIEELKEMSKKEIFNLWAY